MFHQQVGSQDDIHPYVPPAGRVTCMVSLLISYCPCTKSFCFFPLPLEQQFYTVTRGLQGYTVTCGLQGYTVTRGLQGYVDL